MLLGSLLLTQLKGAKDLVLLLVGLTVVLSAGLGLWRGLKGVGRGRERPWLLPPAAFGIGLEVGFSSAGAGALGTLLLLHATRLSPRRWWAPTSSSASSSPSWGAGSTSPSARWPQASSSPWPRAGWRGASRGPLRHPASQGALKARPPPLAPLHRGAARLQGGGPWVGSTWWGRAPGTRSF